MITLTFKPTERHRSALAPPELLVNVWPVSEKIPEGQIEFEPSRSLRQRNVTFSFLEFLKMVTDILKQCDDTGHVWARLTKEEFEDLETFRRVSKVERKAKPVNTGSLSVATDVEPLRSLEGL